MLLLASLRFPPGFSQIIRGNTYPVVLPEVTGLTWNHDSEFGGALLELSKLFPTEHQPLSKVYITSCDGNQYVDSRHGWNDVSFSKLPWLKITLSQQETQILKYICEAYRSDLYHFNSASKQPMESIQLQDLKWSHQTTLYLKALHRLLRANTLEKFLGEKFPKARSVDVF